jgi:hypothetical protein
LSSGIVVAACSANLAVVTRPAIVLQFAFAMACIPLAIAADVEAVVDAVVDAVDEVDGFDIVLDFFSCFLKSRSDVRGSRRGAFEERNE